MSGNQQYRPYSESPGPNEPITDSEAGLESTDYDTDTSYESSDGDYAPQKLFVPPDRADLYRMGGLPQNQLVKSTGGYAQFDKSGADKPIEYGKTQFKTAAQSRQTMILIDSENRDRKAFPQPTQMKLYLPRIYRNVTSVQVQQLKLLSAFLYFRDQKYNTSFKVWEEGRAYSYSYYNINNLNFVTESGLTEVLVKIREGSYSITTLLNELTLQMNLTPTFFYYPNGFEEFTALFSVTGDLGLNFNYPGDYYYDPLTQQYVNNPTFDYIITRYFPQRYVTQTSFTLDELLNAYYYPVLKEALLDPEEILNIQCFTNGPTETGDLTCNNIDIDYVVYKYSGLTDQYVIDLIKINQGELDRYRTTKTFLLSLINKYNWSYNENNNRINVNTTGVNTSIVRYLGQQSSNVLSNAIQINGLNTASFNALVLSANRTNAIATEMYNFLQSNLGTYFGVNYQSYPISQLATSNSYYYIQNGCNVAGVYTSYSPEYINAINNNTISPIPDFNYVPSAPTILWSNMMFGQGAPVIDVNFSTVTYFNDTLIINSTVSQFLNIYDYSLSNIDLNTAFTTSTGIINQNFKYGSVDIVANISAGKYALLAFRSPVRQLLQVETLSKPYIYRYTDYNSNFGGQIPFYFNKDYEFYNNIGAEYTETFTKIKTLSTLQFGDSYGTVSSLAGFSNTYILDIYNNAAYFELITPSAPSTIFTGRETADYSLKLETISAKSTFGTNILMYLYHDYAAFMADSKINSGSNNSNNYIGWTATNAFESTMSFNFAAKENEKYYVIVKCLDVGFPTVDFKFLAYFEENAIDTVRPFYKNFNIYQFGVSTFSEQYGAFIFDNYYFYKTYDSTYIKLPILQDLNAPDSVLYNYLQLSSMGPILGYDSNDVSSDLTDYKGYSNTGPGFVPYSLFSQDPLNCFTFVNKLPYNTTTQQYLYFSTTYNSFFNAEVPYQNEVLVSTTFNYYQDLNIFPPEREYKIVHYWDNTFIGPQTRDALTGWELSGISTLSTLSTMSVYNASSITDGGYLTGPNYSYDLDSNLNISTLRIGQGVYGFTFLPTDGVWNVKKICFKSAYYGLNDPNDNIAYIGVFDTNGIANIGLKSINLSNSLAVLSRTRKIVYTPEFVASNAGFDPSFGTWYQYDLLSNFNYARPDLVAIGLPGYTPYPCTIIGDQGNFYSAIAFDSNMNPTTYFMLCGSVIPNPLYTSSIVSTNYLGFESPDGSAMVFPYNQTGGSNALSNIYQSQYGQSLPIGTIGLNAASEIKLYLDSNTMEYYTPYNNNVGNYYFALRSANYFEGPDHYLMFGDPNNLSTTLCDIYRLRNVGSSNLVRDSVYVSTINISTILPGENILTWTTNSDGLYVMTKGTSSDFHVKIIGISSVVTNPVSTYVHEIPNLMIADFQDFNNYYNCPLLSTNKLKLVVTDNKDWGFIDNVYVSSATADQFTTSTTNGYFKYGGFFQYNNTDTPSTFTSYAWPISRLDTSIDVGYQDVTNMVNSRNIFYLTATSNMNYQIDQFMFSTSQFGTVISPAGLIANIYDGSGTTYITHVARLLVTNSELKNPGKIVATKNDDLYLLYSTFSQKIVYAAVSDDPNGNILHTYSPNLNIFSYTLPIPWTSTSFGIANDSNGGLWISQRTNDLIISPFVNEMSTITIVGNSLLSDDIPYGLSTMAYQIFYPTTKIVLSKKANRYNDLTNITDVGSYNFGGIVSNRYFEYPKVKMFHYLNFSSVLNDIASTSGLDGTINRWKWGMESNYFRADVDYNGYETNAYIYNIPLSTSGALTTPSSVFLSGLDGNADDYNYILIRGYSPDEDYQVMVRFNLTNRYDYGLVNNNIMIDEISTAINGLNLSNWNPAYVQSLKLFDQQFSTTQVYGEGIVAGFAGSTLTTTNFSSFYTLFSSFYGQYLSSQTVVNRIQSEYNSSYSALISSYFSPIYPSTNTIFSLSYLNAIPFDLQFASSIAPQLENKTTFWGLGYNLGFDKSNYIGRTFYTAPTFFKILDDYIYLQLNDELSMNVLDTTGNENLSTVQESTGEVKKYFSKLLLNTFGNYATTLIGTTVTFNPPLGKLDKLNFSWVDVEGNVIDNDNCEWSCVFLINEQSDVQTFESVLPKLNFANSNQIMKL